jgi:hypothetical protein
MIGPPSASRHVTGKPKSLQEISYLIYVYKLFVDKILISENYYTARSKTIKNINTFEVNKRNQRLRNNVWL